MSLAECARQLGRSRRAVADARMREIDEFAEIARRDGQEAFEKAWRQAVEEVTADLEAEYRAEVAALAVDGSA